MEYQALRHQGMQEAFPAQVGYEQHSSPRFFRLGGELMLKALTAYCINYFDMNMNYFYAVRLAISSIMRTRHISTHLPPHFSISIVAH